MKKTGIIKTDKVIKMTGIMPKKLKTNKNNVDDNNYHNKTWQLLSDDLFCVVIRDHADKLCIYSSSGFVVDPYADSFESEYNEFSCINFI
uniref:Uncharacterized protein n=1 Tax=Trichobilharzia regenti TaxID=157069 RepID=A0AA85KHE7_TRIRE|nr:unnamed protein product [Trichobilharzia regenti]